MAKRRRGSCSETDNKGLDQHNSVDRISELPADLLVCILSFLNRKEAISTSVLCRRWRYLWTFIHKLDFDGRESLLKLSSKGYRKALLQKERLACVEWVDRVLALHKNSTIEEFRVFFDLDKYYKNSIGKWIRYVLDRKIQRLELNLTDEYYGLRGYDKYCNFPYEILLSDNPIAFKFLKSIHMNCVNVSGEALEFFLCNCPVLENLSVTSSGKLSSLHISGSSPSLKRLEISLCHNLKSVEIRDSNLGYLKYEGPRIHFLLENVPHLVEMFIGGMITKHMEDVIFLLCRNLPLLEIFTIDFLKTRVSWEDTEMFRSAVIMWNLKKLVVKLNAYKDCSILPLTNLIRASPCLQRFVLKAYWWQPKIVKRRVERERDAKSRYIHLKELEFVGYYGRISDLELVMHLVENSVSLEKIVVDPRDAMRPDLMYRVEVEEEEKEVRARVVEQLRNKVAPPINLTIL